MHYMIIPQIMYTCPGSAPFAEPGISQDPIEFWVGGSRGIKLYDVLRQDQIPLWDPDTVVMGGTSPKVSCRIQVSMTRFHASHLAQSTTRASRHAVTGGGLYTVRQTNERQPEDEAPNPEQDCI